MDIDQQANIEQQETDIVAYTTDYTNDFTTNESFTSKHDLVTWVKDAGLARGTVIVTRSSSSGKTGNCCPSMSFACDRSGMYRSHMKVKKSKRQTESRKCQCPFSLRAQRVGNDEWRIKVKCGKHNHPPANYIPGHSDEGMLKGKEIDTVNAIGNSNVRPAEILKSIKETAMFPSTTIKSIYNARDRIKKGKKVDLVSKLKELSTADRNGSTDHDRRGANCHNQLKNANTSAYNMTQGKEYTLPGKVDDQIEQMEQQADEKMRVVCKRMKQTVRKRKTVGVHRDDEIPDLNLSQPSPIPYIDQFPVGLIPYIVDIQDMKADGNCGYRAVADQIGKGEDAWKEVKIDMLREMNTNYGLYVKIMSEEIASNNKRSVAFMDDHPLSTHWMDMPSMGFVIASTFNCVVHFLSMKECVTIFPLRTHPEPIHTHRPVIIGHVNGNHFVTVDTEPGWPIPPVANLWSKYHDKVASGWVDGYVHRMHNFKLSVSRCCKT